jgi:hypothetical protein
VSKTTAAVRDETARPGISFVEAFRAAHGRAPRVLHVGNIANNAYLNAKILNRHGFDCDVICHDYYHIMGCPEWEECDVTGPIADHFRPDWTALQLGGYQRPRWFAQGPREFCIEYLIAKRRGDQAKAEDLWAALGWSNHTTRLRGGILDLGALRFRLWLLWLRAAGMASRARHLPDAYRATWQKLTGGSSTRPIWLRLTLTLVAPVALLVVWALRLTSIRQDQSLTEAWTKRFRSLFPSRQDQLTADDLRPHLGTIDQWSRLFACYDIVQAYATDVVLPMLAGKRPYLGFEHGTLRVFTMADNSTSRLTALGYRLADHVLITNGDCLEYAHQIGVTSYTAMLHPFDDEFMKTVEGNRDELHRKYRSDYVFLCPLRHDWEIKGTDKYIRALPAIVQQLGRRVKVIMTEWGGQVEQSRELAAALGVGDLIAWSPPLNRIQLVRHLKSVDIVFDQIALPCFGGTAPQAIASKVPVIMSYDPVSTEWLIPEPAPILTAWSAEEIAASVCAALDPAWRAEYERRGVDWYERFHSSRQVVDKHAEAYMKVCREAGLLAEVFSTAKPS